MEEYPIFPREISNIILSEVAPQDIPNICLVNRDMSSCKNALIKYYGKDGYDVINSLTYEQFVKLSNMLWPTLDFTSKQNDDRIITQLLHRALSLSYNDEVNEIGKIAYNKSFSVYREYTNNLLLSYSLRMKGNLPKDRKLVKVNNIGEGEIENDNYSLLRYIENEGDISKWSYKYIIKCLSLLNFSSYPSLVFNILKSYIFVAEDWTDGKKETKPYVNDTFADRMILKQIYELPLGECNNYIRNNLNRLDSIKDDIKKLLPFVYTQRKNDNGDNDYDVHLAAYLFKYNRGEIFNRVSNYIIIIGDYDLYKLVEFIKYNRWDDVLTGITTIDNVLAVEPAVGYIKNVLTEYSDIMSYYNIRFISRLIDESRLQDKSIVSYFHTMRSFIPSRQSNPMLDVFFDISIVQLFIFASFDKGQFIDYLRYALDRIVL
ncbi:F-box domain-containing protein [Orpheovirus IHUMI-LCC2]|uniref:F-box domain-containing protein n=1 Tax=Orpheovirus IHUMI-LCC2 TaxID=2023057 RepID=A0A2I2L5F5_9VIRU|nr:F-box domain-containing protein [Orpheovirus IHUMI-LCC2]SNW62757.1 F-box domain-containing protein [Orpheovirus IHUMI-LCC2]